MAVGCCRFGWAPSLILEDVSGVRSAEQEEVDQNRAEWYPTYRSIPPYPYLQPFQFTDDCESQESAASVHFQEALHRLTLAGHTAATLRSMPVPRTILIQ